MDLNAQCALINRAHNAEANYEKTLALLRALKAGAVRLADVTPTADGWTLTASPGPEVNGVVPEAVAERLSPPAP